MEHIYQHFRADEKPLIQKAEQWVEQSENYYTPILTPFLNPRECYILLTIARNHQQNITFYSAFEDSEYQRALIYPEYYEPSVSDFETEVMEIQYAMKFNTLTHSQILGTLLSQGIQRNHLGDIVQNKDRFQFETTKALADFLKTAVTKIAKVPVSLTTVEPSDILLKEEQYSIENTTISSFRLDNIVSTVYNIPRQRAKEYIQKEYVKVNYAPVDRPDFQITCNDLISVRKKGRLKMIAIDDTKTKKNRYRIQYAVIRK